MCEVYGCLGRGKAGRWTWGGRGSSLCPLSRWRLGRSGVPGSFLALPLTPGVTLGQILNSCSGICLLLCPKERKGPPLHCPGLPQGPKGQRRKPGERGGRATSKNPHAVLYQVPQSPLPQIPVPASTTLILPFLQRSGDLSTYLILFGAPSSAGEARGGGDRQEAGAVGENPQARGGE